MKSGEMTPYLVVLFTCLLFLALRKSHFWKREDVNISITFEITPVEHSRCVAMIPGLPFKIIHYLNRPLQCVSR